jgi:hypothetical protein
VEHGTWYSSSASNFKPRRRPASGKIIDAAGVIEQHGRFDIADELRDFLWSLLSGTVIPEISAA